MVTAFEMAKNQMSDKAEEIKGTLRVTATHGYTSTVLFKHICKFSKLYPHIKIQMKCHDNDLDLTKREADVAIRPFDPHASELEQTFLYERHLQLFASEGYIRDIGTPKTLNDLGTHRLICFDIQGGVIPHTINSNWPSPLGTQPSITVNSVECLAQAADEGLGIITLSHDSSLIEKYKLLRILPDIQGPSLKAYYVYPTSIKNLKKVQLFGNYLKKTFTDYSSTKAPLTPSQE
jgi:DNA-binding transcriptional LysR family regulator